MKTKAERPFAEVTREFLRAARQELERLLDQRNRLCLDMYDVSRRASELAITLSEEALRVLAATPETATPVATEPSSEPTASPVPTTDAQTANTQTADAEEGS